MSNTPISGFVYVTVDSQSDMKTLQFMKQTNVKWNPHAESPVELLFSAASSLYPNMTMFMELFVLDVHRKEAFVNVVDVFMRQTPLYVPRAAQDILVRIKLENDEECDESAAEPIDWSRFRRALQDGVCVMKSHEKDTDDVKSHEEEKSHLNTALPRNESQRSLASLTSLSRQISSSSALKSLSPIPMPSLLFPGNSRCDLDSSQLKAQAMMLDRLVAFLSAESRKYWAAAHLAEESEKKSVSESISTTIRPAHIIDNEEYDATPSGFDTIRVGFPPVGTPSEW
jgi:hypothetical protein